MAGPNGHPVPQAAEIPSATQMSPPRTVRVAAVQADAGDVPDNETFREKIVGLVRCAVAQKPPPEILVFPEDVGLWIELGYRRHWRARYKSLRVWLLEILARRFRDDVIAGRRQTVRTGRPQHCFPFDGKGVSASPGGQSPVGSEPAAHRGTWQWLGSVVDWVFVHFVRVWWLGLWLGRSGIRRLYVKTFAEVARQYRIVIVGGSILDRRGLRLYNTCYVFDSDGSVAGKYDKHHLIGVETALGICRGKEIRPVQTLKYRIGALICYDFNFDDVASALAKQGAQILCGGSWGWRPEPNYPYDPNNRDDAPQRWRCQETNLAAVRAYQAGWIFPDLLYCDGLSDIVVPAKDGDRGDIVMESFPDKRSQQCILTRHVPLGQGTLEVEILSSGVDPSAAPGEVLQLLLRFPLQQPFAGDPKEQAVLSALEQALQPIADARFTGATRGAISRIGLFLRGRPQGVVVKGLGMCAGSPEVLVALEPRGGPLRRDQLREFIDDTIERAEPLAEAVTKARS